MQSDTFLTDKTEDIEPLLEAVRRGDRAALERVVADYYVQVEKAVQRRLRRRFRNQGRAVAVMFSTGDVVHGVFMKVLAGKIQLDCPTPAYLVAYLVRAVETQIVDMTKFHQAERRDRRRHQAAGDADDRLGQLTARSGSPADKAWDSEQRGIYVDVISSFDLPERELLVLRIEHGKTFEQIAVQRGFRTEDAARKAFHSAKARLLVRLAARGIDLLPDRQNP